MKANAGSKDRLPLIRHPFLIAFSRCFLKGFLFCKGKVDWAIIPTPPVLRLAALNWGILFQGLPFPLLLENLPSYG